MRRPGLTGITILCATIAGCIWRIEPGRPLAPDYWPTLGWRSSSPEAQGMDSGMLSDAVGFVRKEGIHVHSLLIVRHGTVVLDASFYPFASGSLHDLASGTKSFVSTLIGIAIDQGYLKSVKQPVVSVFSDRAVENLDADKRSMTLADVLTMRSGLRCIWSNLGGPMEELNRSPDWVQYILDQPMSAKPGTRYCYSNADSHLLSGILRASTGKPAAELAREHLFGALGITDFIWPADPQGNNVGYSELRLAPRDMAKLGFLFLHRGLWDGKQIVSSVWIEEATRAHHRIAVASDDPLDGYGFQWWASSRGFYTTRGRGGQFIAVFPSLDMVLVMTAEIGDDEQMRKVVHMLTTMLLPAARSTSPLAPNPEGVALLASRVDEAGQAPLVVPDLVDLPKLAGRISGKSYRLDANPLGLSRLSLLFQEGSSEAKVRMELSPGETIELPVGLDGVLRFGKGRFGLPAAMKGHWEGDSVFEAVLDELGNNALWAIRVVFDDNSISFMALGAGMGEVKLSGILED